MVTSSYLNFYSKKERKFKFGGEVKVRVLPPFQTKGMKLDSVNQLTKHLQDRMQKEYDLLNKEMNLEERYYTKPALNESMSSNNYENKCEKLDSSNISLNQSFSLDEKDKTINDDNNNSINEEENKKFN